MNWMPWKVDAPGTAPKIVAFCCAIAAGIAIAGALRGKRRRISLSAPQPFHHLRESLEYRAPVEKVFACLTAFEDYPRYLEEIAWARKMEPSRYRFGLYNPAGELTVWEVIVTRLVPNQYLEWYSTSESMIQCSGRARFRNRPEAAHVDFEIESAPGLGWMVEWMERFAKDGLPAWMEAALSEETESRPA